MKDMVVPVSKDNFSIVKEDKDMWDRNEDEDKDNSINSKGDPALTTFLNKKL